MEVFSTAKFSCLRLPLVKVLASSGDEAFVEDSRGTRLWVRSCDLVVDPTGNWCFISTKQKPPFDAFAIVQRALTTQYARTSLFGPSVVAKGVWYFEGALEPEELAQIHACAESCLKENWGTVRRRTVGAVERMNRSPTMTHVRLTSQFAMHAPLALAKLRRLTLLCVDNPKLSVKQCDYLLYGPGDYAGWHDHAGESTVFLVALLYKDGACDGGNFEVRDVPAGAILRAPGDVVVCLSRTDHRVSPVRSGSRISINLDFWDLGGEPDRRSQHDII